MNQTTAIPRPSTVSAPQVPAQAVSHWLERYYYGRAAFSLVWVALAFTVGRSVGLAATLLLAIYPAWDALANLVDAKRSGGLKRNPAQAVNFLAGIATTVAAVIALGRTNTDVVLVFGVWAIVAGLLQLTAAVRRWSTQGAQWAMILSGAQSALAGAFFIKASAAPTPAIEVIAPYATLGAVYFLISAVLSTIRRVRRRTAAVA